MVAVSSAPASLGRQLSGEDAGEPATREESMESLVGVQFVLRLKYVTDWSVDANR